MHKVTYISDYLLKDRVGGAELNDDALLSKMRHRFEISTLDRNTLQSINDLPPSNNFILLSDFCFLSTEILDVIKNNYQYGVIEHDWKIEANRMMFRVSEKKSFAILPGELRYFDFLQSASFIACQSAFHKAIYVANTLYSNIHSLNGNIWSDEHIDMLREAYYNNENKEKTLTAIVGGKSALHRHIKGTDSSIDYCKSNNIDYRVIEPCDTKSFYNQLAECKSILIMPNWPESFSRVFVEAIVLGLDVSANDFVGAMYTQFPAIYQFGIEEKINLLRNTSNTLADRISDAISSIISVTGLNV